MAAGQNVAGTGDGERQSGEDHRKDLQPPRAQREHQLESGAEPQHRAESSHREFLVAAEPSMVRALTGSPRPAAGSLSREAVPSCASSPEPIGVCSRVCVNTAERPSTHVPVR